ncbi:GNAT family N-acetyltransferase [Desertihabitans brevis]|uniref:GNAT family N-acetyltransferase n=1 Tax=Desertihabitans brevis TaxID=2268447 RepID=UPI0018F7B65A|nr:GNAT family N-acetyltransferase [Desertihabitans brevis]
MDQETGRVRLETERLLLRPWRPEEARVQRELWAERDPRVPASRRIDAEGRPSLTDLERWIREDRGLPRPGLLALETRGSGEVVGYCGLVAGRGDLQGQPELAFELLRRVHGQGLATEAARAVLDWVREHEPRRVWATVREWNTASRRVLAKLGFVETGRVDADPVHGDSIYTALDL